MNICKKKLSDSDKEMLVLHNAINYIENKSGKLQLNSPEIKKIIEIVENFIRKKKVICYGGTAINNLLPIEDQFYNKEVEFPDYDFYSSKALNDSKELADIYYKNGFLNVEAKAGQHFGTYKVYVNFYPVADITQLETKLFNILKNKAIKTNGILYSPPNYLRMAMYNELARPAGDISRWEKILKRLTLLNKVYPLKGEKCDKLNFLRSFENTKTGDIIFDIAKNTFINNGVIFFGGYACNLYSEYMPKNEKKQMSKYPDFDVLSLNPEILTNILKERLQENGFNNVKINKLPKIGENISEHYEIVVNEETIAFIYKPLGCVSYNTIKINNNKINVASIDTMLQFYLAFLYADKPYYDPNRILCMSEYLMDVQKKNKFNQKGLLRRFSYNCYGFQDTKEIIMERKYNKFKELKDKTKTIEYETWFLKYDPAEKYNKTKKNKTKLKTKFKTKSKTKSKKYNFLQI